MPLAEHRKRPVGRVRGRGKAKNHGRELRGGCRRDGPRIQVYVFLFLLFLLCLRAFDYYIVDGYENILLFFDCFIILDKVIESYTQVSSNSGRSN